MQTLMTAPVIWPLAYPNGEVIELKIVRSVRRKDICAYAEVSGIEVRVPHKASDAEIQAWLRIYSRWLFEHGTRIKREWAQVGFLYLGERYELEFAPNALPSVHFNRERKCCEIGGYADFAAAKSMLITYCRQQAEAAILPHWLRFLPRAYREPVGGRWTWSSARRMYGGCTRSGRIRLSWRLVHAAPEAVAYVVVHELAHLRVMDHSARFWEEVARIDPEWKEGADWLQRYGPFCARML